jgi:hypothetical protein
VFSPPPPLFFFRVGLDNREDVRYKCGKVRGLALDRD